VIPIQGFDLLLLLDFHIAVTVTTVVLAWKWGDWRNWKLYYPTMLYFIVGNFSYTLLTYNYPLWEFESPLLKTTGSNFLITMISFPAVLLVFLPHYPSARVMQILYILVWTAANTLIEWIAYLSGFFSYHNGWNIWWSALFNAFMFALLRLHHKKPPAAWLLTIIVAWAVLFFYFKVPFSSMR